MDAVSQLRNVSQWVYYRPTLLTNPSLPVQGLPAALQPYHGALLWSLLGQSLQPID